MTFSVESVALILGVVLGGHALFRLVTKRPMSIGESLVFGVLIGLVTTSM